MKGILISLAWAVIMVIIALGILKFLKSLKLYNFQDFNYKKAFLGNKIKIFLNNDTLISKISANVKGRRKYLTIKPYFRGVSEEESIICVSYSTGECAYYIYQLNSFKDKVEFYQIYHTHNFNPNKLKFKYYIERN